MASSIQNVHHGHRQLSGMTAAQILIKRNSQSFRSRPCHCQRNTQNCIGSYTAFIVCSIDFCQKSVYIHLIKRIFSHNCFRKFCIYIIYSFFHTEPKVFSFFTIPELHCLKSSGRRPGGNYGSCCISMDSNNPFSCCNFNLNRRISPGVQDLSCVNSAYR